MISPLPGDQACPSLPYGSAYALIFRIPISQKKAPTDKWEVFGQKCLVYHQATFEIISLNFPSILTWL